MKNSATAKQAHVRPLSRVIHMFNRNRSEDRICIRAERVLTNSPVICNPYRPVPNESHKKRGWRTWRTKTVYRVITSPCFHRVYAVCASHLVVLLSTVLANIYKKQKNPTQQNDYTHSLKVTKLKSGDVPLHVRARDGHEALGKIFYHLRVQFPPIVLEEVDFTVAP
eukprot:5224656-Pyramimonas_sp.AAC.1